MHKKYIVIDGKTIETGSFNYTTNAENVIVIDNNTRVAKRYLKDWQRLWDGAVDFEDTAVPTLSPDEV